jgi:hypothetical protein
MAAPYWEYAHWVGYVAVGISIWRLPLGVIRLVVAFTNNRQRHKQCMEVLRLARRDASSIPTYLAEASLPPQELTSKKIMSTDRGL